MQNLHIRLTRWRTVRLNCSSRGDKQLVTQLKISKCLHLLELMPNFSLFCYLHDSLRYTIDTDDHPATSSTRWLTHHAYGRRRVRISQRMSTNGWPHSNKAYSPSRPRPNRSTRSLNKQQQSRKTLKSLTTGSQSILIR